MNFINRWFVLKYITTTTWLWEPNVTKIYSLNGTHIKPLLNTKPRQCFWSLGNAFWTGLTIFLFQNIQSLLMLFLMNYRGADKSLARPGGNKLEWQQILSFIYPIYNHNWRNISTIYIYKTRLTSNETFSPSNKIQVGRAKDLSAPL